MIIERQEDVTAAALAVMQRTTDPRLLNSISELQTVELPRGFGRD